MLGKSKEGPLSPWEGGRKSLWEEGQEIPLHNSERKELLKIMTMKILHLEISKTDLKKESGEMASSKQHIKRLEKVRTDELIFSSKG